MVWQFSQIDINFHALTTIRIQRIFCYYLQENIPCCDTLCIRGRGGVDCHKKIHTGNYSCCTTLVLSNFVSRFIKRIFSEILEKNIKISNYTRLCYPSVGVIFIIDSVPGLASGVVVDIGDGVTHICPVYHSYAMPHLVTRLDIAGRDVTNYLIKVSTSWCQCPQFNGD